MIMAIQKGLGANHSEILYRSVAGAVAGFLATFPMTVTMKGIHRTLPAFRRHSIPPRKITMRILRKLQVGPFYGNKKRTALTMASHFGYGAAGGAAYGTFSRGIPLPPVVKGTIFGLAVWAGSYFGWLPAAKILRPDSEHWTRHAMMAAAHVVWGSAVGIAYERIMERRK